MPTEILLEQRVSQGELYYIIFCIELNFTYCVKTREESGMEIVDLIQQHLDRQFTIRMVKA